MPLKLVTFNLIKRIITCAAASILSLETFSALSSSFWREKIARAYRGPVAFDHRERGIRESLRTVQQVSGPWNKDPGDKGGRKSLACVCCWRREERERKKEEDKEKIRRAPNIDGARRASTLNALRSRTPRERFLVVLPHRLFCAYKRGARF